MAMDVTERPSQAVLIAGDGDDVDVVRHQHQSRISTLARREASASRSR